MILTLGNYISSWTEISTFLWLTFQFVKPEPRKKDGTAEQWKIHPGKQQDKQNLSQRIAVQTRDLRPNKTDLRSGQVFFFLAKAELQDFENPILGGQTLNLREKTKTSDNYMINTSKLTYARWYLLGKSKLYSEQLNWFDSSTKLLFSSRILFGTLSPLRFHDILDLLSFLSAKGWRFGNWDFLQKTPQISKCLMKQQGILTSDPTLTCSQDDPSSVPHSEVMAHQPRLKEHCSQGPPISNKLQLLKVSNECSQIRIVVRGGIVFIQMHVYVPCMYI